MEGIGIRFERQRGSHMRYRGSWRGQERNVTLVAGQKAVSPRTLASILQQAGLSPNELARLVQGEQVRE